MNLDESFENLRIYVFEFGGFPWFVFLVPMVFIWLRSFPRFALVFNSVSWFAKFSTVFPGLYLFHCFYWFSLVFRDFLWFSVVFFGSPWFGLVFLRFRRFSLVLRSSPWFYLFSAVFPGSRWFS